MVKCIWRKKREKLHFLRRTLSLKPWLRSRKSKCFASTFDVNFAGFEIFERSGMRLCNLFFILKTFIVLEDSDGGYDENFKEYQEILNPPKRSIRGRKGFGGKTMRRKFWEVFFWIYFPSFFGNCKCIEWFCYAGKTFFHIWKLLTLRKFVWSLAHHVCRNLKFFFFSVVSMGKYWASIVSIGTFLKFNNMSYVKEFVTDF